MWLASLIEQVTVGRKLILSGKSERHTHTHTHTPLPGKRRTRKYRGRTVVVLAFWGGRPLGEGISWLTCAERWSVRTTLQRAPFLMDGRGMLVVFLEISEQIWGCSESCSWFPCVSELYGVTQTSWWLQQTGIGKVSCSHLWFRISYHFRKWPSKIPDTFWIVTCNSETKIN